MTSDGRTLNDPPADIRQWCRCDCGKLHTTAGITSTTLCSCGRRLYERAFFGKTATQAEPSSPVSSLPTIEDETP